MKPDESGDEPRFGRLLRAALPPPPPSGADPARAEDDFFAALAAEDAAAGVPPPPAVAARLAAVAKRAAAARASAAGRRISFGRRAAAAAAAAALVGLAGAATIALREAFRDARPSVSPPGHAALSNPDGAAPADRREASGRTDGVPVPALGEADAANRTPDGIASITDNDARAGTFAPAAERIAPPAPVPPPPSAPLDADAVLRDAEDVRAFLLEWQEALLPLSSAVTQEVGVVALAPDGADAAAWFASLWPDRGADAFPALLLDDLGDAVLTNLAAAGRAAAEAPEDYDPAWLLDATLPGIPEEHREALLPFYDPALVTLRFEAVPDASRFAELAESETPPSTPPATRFPSSVATPATNAAGGLEHATGTLPTVAPGGLATPPQAASNRKSGEAEATPPPVPDFKTIQRLLYREFVTPFYAGPDGLTHWRRDGAAQVWSFALALGRGRLLDVPNRDWGGAYDLVVRHGADDPFLRFCAALGAWKWGWTEKARELRDDLAFRLAGGDATPLQALLLAHLDQRFEPDGVHETALREAFGSWSATLSGEFDRDDVRAWLGRWLVEDAVAAGARPAAGGDAVRAARAAAVARHAADPAPDASPKPGAVPVYEDFVQATFLPLLLREVVAPLEGLERDRGAPWRAMALAALREECLRTARGGDRPDPVCLGRAVSAAGRGCPWPAVRFLAAIKEWDDAVLDPDAVVYGTEDPDAARRAEDGVRRALEAAGADAATTPLARHLMHRAFAARLARLGRGGAGDADSFRELVADRPWPGAEARAVWLLAPAEADWTAVADSASDDWLCELALGRGAADRSDKAVAQGHFERAAALRPDVPEPWIERLRRCADTPAEARAFHDEATRRELDAPGAASAMLDALRPARGGSVEAILAFGDECLAGGRFDTGVPLAWARSRFLAASLAGDDWEAPFRGEEAITNMDRIADALLARPGATKNDFVDALHLRVWPLYANNDFATLLAVCDALGAAEGGRARHAADFEPGHPMRRCGLGAAYGLTGHHRGAIADALRRWRVEGDLSGAREILRACAGRVSSATNTVDNWEQSFVAGRLAVLDCALARPGDGPYPILPAWGTPGPRKFWRSREDNVRFDPKNEFRPGSGVWWTDRRAGQAAASEPVLPVDARLSLAVGFFPPDAEPARFWIVPENDAAMGADPRPVDGLLAEFDASGRCTLGWARLDLFGRDAAPVGEPAGPRVPVAPSPDGLLRFELDLAGGDVAVRCGGRPLPELARPGLVAADRPHAVAFAGRLFGLCQADASALPRRADAAQDTAE